jgi:type I restriction enzyme M protein
VGYGDYLEQLTYRIFLKMADEYAKPPRKAPMTLTDVIGEPERFDHSTKRK